jgi:hypothetical protein
MTTSELRIALEETETRISARRRCLMTAHVAAVVAFGVGCLSTAGCHKATFYGTIADLSRERQSRLLAPDMGAACTVMVDNTDWDGSLFAREFWKQGDGFVWFPEFNPPMWIARIPTGEAGADDAIRLCLSFRPTQQLPIVLGTMHARRLHVPLAQITVKTDPWHDLVSVSWWASPDDRDNSSSPIRWSGECIARLPFRRAPP